MASKLSDVRPSYGTLVIGWTGPGFGDLMITVAKDGKVTVDSETMGREFARKALRKLADYIADSDEVRFDTDSPFKVGDHATIHFAESRPVRVKVVEDRSIGGQRMWLLRLPGGTEFVCPETDMEEIGG